MSSTIFLCIVIFLLCLAVFDLFVGVSNDAVNFLNSAIGAKVAKFKTIMIVASIGVVIGACLSSGMMDVARHGILTPKFYTFQEVMTVFLAVMVTDVVLLDVFNTLGMPTSTTVSLVFELLGGTFVMAVMKMASGAGALHGATGYADLLNSEKALQVIIAIFVSVAIAFVFGVIVQWIARVVFTFSYKKHLRYTIALFGGLSATAILYFILIKGLGEAPFMHGETQVWIKENTTMLMACVFVGCTILMEILHLAGVKVFKVIVLLGTFALAMAFASNDLVNFLGVPLSGLDSYWDFMANHGTQGPNEFLMVSLQGESKNPYLLGFLIAAGAIMIIAMTTSKKALNVIKTSVDLSRQDEGDQMFGTSKAARSIVRATQDAGSALSRFVPVGVGRWVNSRFNKNEVILEDEGAAFDTVRASVNLVLAALLIVLGTTYKLPLSTTYVTFMVAMGTSLADRAWSRESAVFRVTGVLSVIGGWFITAGAAFVMCAIVCMLMHLGGIIIMAAFMALDIYLLIRSNRQYNKKMKMEKEDVYRVMMRSHDPEIIWDLLSKRFAGTQSHVTRFALDAFNHIVEGLANQDVRGLRRVNNELKNEQLELKKLRKQDMMGLKKLPIEIALERNTWFHLGANSDQQFLYCLRRMLDPIREHVDNNFNPIPQELIDEFAPIKEKITRLMTETEELIANSSYENYRDVLAEADACKDELSVIRKRQMDRIQEDKDNSNFSVFLVYLNLLQESQEFLSTMRHQLRSAKKFIAN